MTVRYWRPGFHVYWREPGSSQIGVDPRCAAVLDDLDPIEQALLERLPQVGSETGLAAVAHSYGVGRGPVRRLLDRLDAAGYLCMEPPLSASADDRYWHVAAVAGQQPPQQRERARLAIQGLDQIGLRTARIAAQAGVGTLLLIDDRPVMTDDISSDGYPVTDLGLTRRDRAMAILRPAFPQTSFSIDAHERPDMVVLIEHGVADPVRSRPLMRDDVTHLPVLIRELDVMVGPLVRPGRGPCLRCLDLHRSDADERWPAVATQVAANPASGTESVLSWFAAALTAHQTIATLDGRASALEGTSLEISATYPVPRQRTWTPHPSCGCAAASVLTEHADLPGQLGGVSERTTASTWAP